MILPVELREVVLAQESVLSGGRRHYMLGIGESNCKLLHFVSREHAHNVQLGVEASVETERI